MLGKQNWILFLKLVYFNLRIITFQYCDGFAIHQHELATGIHVSSPILNAPPTSLPTPFLWIVREHWLWVPCFMPSNSHWSSVLHMVMYMFQCYSLKSSHSLLVLLSPKDDYLHLFLLCCPACRSSVPPF